MSNPDTPSISRATALADRAVIAFLEPYRAKLETWQVEAATIRGLRDFSRSSRQDWFGRAATLFTQVIDASTGLSVEGDQFASSSRVRDTQRALAKLAAELNAMLG